MRVGQFEVTLVKENGDAYKERQIGGKTYVQGEEGQEYQVKVNVHQATDGTFPAKYLRFGLLVDGDDIGSKKRLDLSSKVSTFKYSQPASCTILGFPSQTHAQKSFTFTLPSLTSNDANYKADLGSVKLLVSEAHKTGQLHPIRASKNFQERNAPRIIEDKKFYEQASLVTSAGTEKAQNSAHFKKKNNKSGPMASVWVTVRDIPEAAMVLYYHCRSTLDFLEEQETRRKRAAELVIVHSNGSCSSSAVPLVDLTATGAVKVEDSSVIELEREVTQDAGLLVDLSAETSSERSSVEVVGAPVAGLKRARVITVGDSSADSEEILPLKVVKTERT